MINTVFKSRTWEALLPLVCFSLYAFFATYLNPSQAPDEFHRLLVPAYIYKYGTLPLGNDPLIIGSVYGTSYGFAPYGPSLISAIAMRIASLFGADSVGLIIAARLVSCISGALMVFVCIRIGRRLFRNDATAVFLGFLVGFLPQLAFLSSYLNNDVASACACAIVILSWVRGIQDGWSARTCLLLGFGLGGCALTYYFGYGFILCSIPVFFISHRRHTKTKPEAWSARHMWGMAGLIFLVAMVVGGWFFVRNAILYNGDIFGMSTSNALSQTLAVEEYKPSNRVTLRSTGVSPIEMLLNTSWWKSSFKSFFGLFGYMAHQLPSKLYACYTLVLVAAVIGIAGFRWVRLDNERTVALIAMIACMIIPMMISLYYSWAIDYQAQGRYLFSALAPLMIFAANGVEATGGFIYRCISRVAGSRHTATSPHATARHARTAISVVASRKSSVSTALILICVVCYIVLFVLSMTTTMIPSCLYGVTVPDAVTPLLASA